MTSKRQLSNADFGLLMVLEAVNGQKREKGERAT